jgi:hypothetical protein
MADQEHQEGPGPLPEWEPLSPSISQKVHGIIEAAEQAAAEIRHDTEVQAQRRQRETEELLGSVDEGLRRLCSVADELSAQLRREFEDLVTLMRRPATRPRLGADPSPPEIQANAPAPQPSSTGGAPDGAPSSGVRPEWQTPEGSISPDEADAASQRLTPERQVAIKMALEGRSREEVQERLEAGFGLRDVDPILDGVFGKQRA